MMGANENAVSIPAGEHDGLQIKFTRTPRVDTPNILTLVEPLWGQFVAKAINEPPRASRKDGLPLVKMVRFGRKVNEKGHLRHDDNVEAVYGLTGDYDAGQVALEEAAALLLAAGIEGFLHTTPSHAPGAPRWRVFAPLSCEHSPRDYKRLMNHLNDKLGGILATESWKLSQMFYVGRVDGVPYETRRVHGRPIDLLCGVGEAPANDADAAAANGPFVAYNRKRDIAAFTDERWQDLASAVKYLAERKGTESYADWIDTGLALACFKGTPFEDPARELFHEASGASAKYDAGECEKKWESFSADRITYRSLFDRAQKLGWKPAYVESFGKTEFANAARLLARYGDELMFVPELESWHRYNGKVWESTPTAEVERLAADVVRALPALALQIEDAQQRTDFLKFAAASQKAQMVRNMTVLASRQRIVRADRLDQGVGVLNVGNGIVDLRTGQLHPHDPARFLTCMTPVNYNPRAEAPLWRQTLLEIFNGDEEMVAFQQRLSGYAAIGDPIEHKLPIPHGLGANGKSTVLNTIQYVMGGYAASCGAQTFITAPGAGNASGPREDLVRLRGKRLVIVNESAEGGELREETVKSIASTDIIAARGVYAKHTIEIRPSWVAFMPTNHKPIVKGTDTGIWRRLLLIPFERNFHDDPTVEKDPARGAKLLAEAEGILRWIVEGAMAYHTHGLQPPASVIAAAREYRSDMDLLADWIDECCELGDFTERMGNLWVSWKRWAEDRGTLRYVPSDKALGRRLAGRAGISKGHSRSGAVYAGLRVRQGPEFPVRSAS